MNLVSAAMSEDWYYAEGRDRRGPLSFTELQDLVEAGVIQRGTMVWHDGDDGWFEAGQLPELFPEPPPRPRPRRKPASEPPGESRHKQRKKQVLSVGEHFQREFGAGGILVASGALLLLIGALMPWSHARLAHMSHSSGGMKYWECVFCFVFSILLIVGLVLHHVVPQLKAALLGISLGYAATGILAAGFSLIAALRIPSRSPSAIAEVSLSVGPFFTMGAGAIVACGGAMLIKQELLELNANPI